MKSNGSQTLVTCALQFLIVLLVGCDSFYIRHSPSKVTSLSRLYDKSPEHCESEVRRKLEFRDLEPLEETEARRKRVERDRHNKAQFESFGDGLWDLRSEMEDLSHQLNGVQDAKAKDDVSEENTRQKLRYMKSRDPELAYRQAVIEQHFAEREGRSDDAEEHKVLAVAARSCLPQFNLDGLWVGKYGNRFELINITYVGDTLIAEKVTGALTVPKGAITFQVDLSPLHQVDLRPLHLRKKATDSTPLDPILLTEKAAQKWGTRKLPRYPGLGQVAEANYTNRQWVDGQLIIIGGEYFSFAWLPIEQQIFFGRPSPELALKMLRLGGNVATSESLSLVPDVFDIPPSLDADVAIQKAFVTRCLELTCDHEDEIGEGNNAYGGIWHCSDGEECYLQ